MSAGFLAGDVAGEEVVLLVEDDPDEVFLTEHLFARHALSQRLLVAGDGRSALDLLLPAPPREPLNARLVLLDLNLPHVGGFEVLRQLRADARTLDLPVAVFTTNRTEEQAIAAYQPAVTFIHKPISMRSLRDAGTALGLTL